MMSDKQHRCKIFVAEIEENEIEVRSTKTFIRKAFRCDAPLGLAAMGFYKYHATLLLLIPNS